MSPPRPPEDPPEERLFRLTGAQLDALTAFLLLNPAFLPSSQTEPATRATRILELLRAHRREADLPSALDRAEKLSAATRPDVAEGSQREAIRLYCLNLQERFDLVTIVGAPIGDDSAPARLEQLYVEQAIAESPIAEGDAPPLGLPTALDVCSNYPRLVLLGEPAGGKSTLVQWITWQFAVAHLRPDGIKPDSWPARFRFGPKKTTLPFPFILRELKINDGVNWEDLWARMLDQETMRPLASLNLTSLLKEGRGFFLFDGLDEVSSPAARRSLRDAVHEGMRKYRRCRWLLTSRIIGYEEVPFHEISLTGAAGGAPDQQVQLRYLAPFDDARIRQFATNWYVSRASGSEAKRRSDVLVHAVFRDPSTTSLARVPFLLTLMATVHRNNITLPNGRALLYKLIAEAYVQKRVEAAGLPQRGFPPQQQWACLARVGVELQLRRSAPGRAERDTFLYASPTDVREWLMGVLNRDAGRTSDFLEHLGRRTGLFLPRNEERYTFIHLSFMEFFAAWWLRQEVTSVAWMREQWDKVPEPARQDSLRRYAVDPCWLVPLVMLCELLADEGRRDHLEDCLFPALFGSDFCEVATGSPEDARRGILLARLVIDPHAGWNTAGWDDPLKLRALEVCCQAEIARQQHEQQHLWLYAPEITRILLTIEEEHSSRIVTALADAAEAAGLQALTLDDTGLTDLSPLGRLTSLRSLFLNRTAVADLRPLEGLSELRSLHVRRTKVTSDAVSTLQRVLPQCEVDFEAGRAVVFLSSTFQDLREERAAVGEVCRELGLGVAVIESFVTHHTPLEASFAQLDQCEVYLGIFARRYGHIPSGQAVSVTEMEYDRAGRLGLTRLCFFLEDDATRPADQIDADSLPRLRAFKQRMLKEVDVGFFRDLDGLRLMVYRALVDWMERTGRRRRGPQQMTSLPRDVVGREAEVDALLRAFEQGSVIINIHGIAGVGKTTFAMLFAHKLAHRFPDGLLFYTLDRSGHWQDVAAHVIRSYLPTVALPPDSGALTVLYRTVLSGKRALLLLDDASDARDLEHLRVPESCALLVTSRHRLSLAGIRPWALDTLPINDAVRLLRLRAPHLDDTAATEIAELCGRLPLALQLAGMTLATHPDVATADFAARLRSVKVSSRPGIHEPVSAALSSAEEALPDALRRRWRELAVFVESFPPESAAFVWDVNGDVADRWLRTLRESALLEWDELASRYSLHPLVREYAEHGSSEDARRTAIRRHGLLALTEIQRLDAFYRSPGDGVEKALRNFVEVWPELKAAFDRAREQPKDPEARQLIIELAKRAAALLALRQAEERIAWHSAAVDAAHSSGDRENEVPALLNLSQAFRSQGRLEPTLEFSMRALALSREIGDRRGEGYALGDLASAYSALGQVEKAAEIYLQSLEVAREVNDRRAEGSALGNLGSAYAALGQPQRAVEIYQQGLAIAREVGDRRAEGSALGNLGSAYASLGQVERAISYYEQHLDITREIGDRLSEGNALGDLGSAYASLGQVQRAIGYYEQHLDIAHLIGDRRGEGNALGNLGLAYAALGQVHMAIDFCAEQLVMVHDIGDRRGEGNALGNLGNTDAALGQAERAIGFYEQQLGMVREIGDRRGEGNALGNLGNAYAALGQAERAIGFYEQHLAMSREIGDRRGEGNALGNLGSAYASLGQVQRAIGYYEQHLAIARETGDRLGEAKASWNMGLELVELKRISEAIPLMETCVSIKREIGEPDADKDAARVEEFRARLSAQP